MTLLEVMAAVAILGILYAYLARAASQGILTAGESRWRLEASLVADQVMSDLEAVMTTEGRLQMGEREFEVGEFSVKQTISPFELPAELMAEEADPQAGSEAAPSLLVQHGNTPGILRLIRVRVAWFDGVHEQRIVRYSFGYDVASALPLLELLGGALPEATGLGEATPEAADTGTPTGGLAPATPRRSAPTGPR